MKINASVIISNILPTLCIALYKNDHYFNYSIFYLSIIIIWLYIQIYKITYIINVICILKIYFHSVPPSEINYKQFTFTLQLFLQSHIEQLITDVPNIYKNAIVVGTDIIYLAIKINNYLETLL